MGCSSPAPERPAAGGPDLRHDLRLVRLCRVCNRRLRIAHRGLAGRVSLCTYQTLYALEHALNDHEVDPRDAVVHHGDRGDPISLHPLHRALGRGQHRAIGWRCRRFVRQRTGRVRHRAVRNRGDSTPWPAARLGGGGVHNARLGRLVQQSADPRTDGEPASGRNRSGDNRPREHTALAA